MEGLFVLSWLFAAWLFGHAAALVPGPWSDGQLSATARTRLLVANMTLDEKLAMLHGPSYPQLFECVAPNVSGLALRPECSNTGYLAPNTRLGIPPINLNDGPQGFRDVRRPGTTTSWPSGLTVAASWDADAVREWGSGIAREFREKGSNVMLGPGLNLARVPQNGRNFEYLSGEDPHLGYVLARAAVNGIQSQKVVANAKHFVLNSQETNRTVSSSEADERLRFEMYYPPFEGAIEADVGSVMCSYNKVNRIWSCENPEVLIRDLKGALGFQGFVVSDWWAMHSTSLMAGLDMEMPGSYFMSPELIKPGLAAGTIDSEAIDESVGRILWPLFAVGAMDEPLSTWGPSRLRRNVASEASAASARRLSAMSTVLLKNDGDTLPLRPGLRLALLGLAGAKALVGGGGSGSVVPSYLVTPLEGITAAAGPGAEVVFGEGKNITRARELAAGADFAIVFVGTLSEEAKDRPSLSLDAVCDADRGLSCTQNELVEAVARANPRTIVVASIPGAVLMPWSGRVPAILVNFMPGQQVGHAIADVLFGSVNPSAKLPLTFPNCENEMQMSPAQWPGLTHPGALGSYAYSFYTEKLLVGYRYYDAHGLNFTVGFPFGHGLSYTTFEYSDLAVEGTQVAFTVRNTGLVPGAEVAQLYLGFPASAGEPPLQLKGFRKTRPLAPGYAQRVKLQLRPRDLSIWSAKVRTWTVCQGTFELRVGASSRDLRLAGQLQSPAAAAAGGTRRLKGTLATGTAASRSGERASWQSLLAALVIALGGCVL